MKEVLGPVLYQGIVGLGLGLIIAAIVIPIEWLRRKSRKDYYEKHPEKLSTNRVVAAESVPDLTIKLIDAVTANDIKLVSNLLAVGADPSSKDSNGYSAIDYARGHGHDAVLGVLNDHNNF